MSNAIPSAISRRQLIRGAGIGAAALGAMPLLSACGGLRGSSSGVGGDVLKIGYVSPQTGPLAGFAAADNFVVSQINEAMRSGLTIGGRKRSIEIVVKDTQSSPNRATEATRQLISEGVDLIVGSSTPDTTNPVADQCESNGIPNVTTIAPWEAWFHGRGGKSGEGFEYTTLFFFGMQEFADCFVPMWERAGASTKNVAALWPNDTDANAFRNGLSKLAGARGWTTIDGGAYQNGTTDFTAQITKFRQSEAELFTCTPIPPDFQTFWRQSRQQGFQPKLATVAKVMLFPTEAEALGELSNNIATDIWWSPAHPYKSALDGTTAQQLADKYAESTGKQWTQALGSIYSLFEIAIEALKKASDPKDKKEVARNLREMQLDCMSGVLDFTKGPEPGIAIQHPVGGQWRPGTKFPWDIVIVDNTPNPAVPIGGDLQLTNA